MILDSHAYAQNFRHLTRNSNSYALSEGDRNQLLQAPKDAFAKAPGIIGKIGLDDHCKREEQHRLKQHLWFSISWICHGS